MVGAFSIILLCIYTISNRLVGAPEWKKQIILSRAFSYIMCALACFGFYYYLTHSLTESVKIAGILGITFLVCRQRSPRGAFFLRNGGKAGVWDSKRRKYALLYNGKHSPITAAMATFFSGIDAIFVIENHSGRKDDRNAAAKKLLRYSRYYALLHHTIIFIPVSLILTYLYTPYLLLTPLIGLLYYPVNVISGVNGLWENEEDAGHRAELLEGFFVHGLFALSVIFGGYYG